MSRYPQIVNKIVESPWLITPESLKVILDIMDRRLSGETISDEEIRIRMGGMELEEEDYSTARVMRGVGVLSLQGPIFPKASLMTRMSGASSIEDFKNDFRGMLANDKVSSIVLDVDSPGGLADQIPEMAAEIRAGREVKPIVAVANTNACSAAYYLASQASRMFVTPSGEVGSVGVYTVHEDISRKQEMEGKKTTVISAGRFKAEGSPFEPLSAEAKDHLQSQVNEIYGEFVSNVALGRGVSEEAVLENFGNGRTLRAKQALEVGMVDGIQTLDTVLGRMIESGGQLESISDKVEPIRSIGPGSAAIAAEKESAHRTVSSETKEGEMMDDVLKKFAGELGIQLEDGMDEAAVLAAAKDLKATIEPLRKAKAEGEANKTFRDQFPDEWQKMQNLEAAKIETDARTFAESYARFSVKDGDTEKKSNFGFSSLVLDKIADVHKKYADRSADAVDLKELLDLIGDKGIVDYSERGSARAEDGMNRSDDPKVAFGQAVLEVMKSDELEYEPAISVAAAKHPDLYEAYRRAIPHVNPTTP